jgi:hypothetical protein
MNPSRIANTANAALNAKAKKHNVIVMPHMVDSLTLRAIAYAKLGASQREVYNVIQSGADNTIKAERQRTAIERLMEKLSLSDDIPLLMRHQAI